MDLEEVVGKGRLTVDLKQLQADLKAYGDDDLQQISLQFNISVFDFSKVPNCPESFEKERWQTLWVTSSSIAVLFTLCRYKIIIKCFETERFAEKILER